MVLASNGRNRDFTRSSFHHLISLSMSEDTIRKLSKGFFWGGGGGGDQLISGQNWEPSILPNMDPFIVSHPPPGAFSYNLHTVMDTPPCVTWVVAFLRVQDIIVGKVFCFVNP